ncbi:MAG TPA: response regulator [Chloroflexota bacterium]|nr:response regulator [Chloroflexota bacterium]
MKSVLIADDQSSIRMLVRATIESDAYSIAEASNGDQAWWLIKELRPDLVLLDVEMPGLSGLEVTREVRNDPSLVGTTVILLTANISKTDVEAGLAAGADLYLTKPFSPLELLTVLEKALDIA